MRTKDEKALVKACEGDSLKELVTLLRGGIDPQFNLIGFPKDGEAMKSYKTPLGVIMTHLYSSKAIAMIKLLLDAGADINGNTHHTVNKQVYTPLGRALLSGHSDLTRPEIQLQVIDYLLSHGASVNHLTEADLSDFIHKSYYEHKPQVLEKLLNAGLNPNTVVKGQRLLDQIIGSSNDSDIAMSKLLINSGADLSGTTEDYFNKEKITLAQQAASSEVLQLLLEKKSNFLNDLTLDDLPLNSPPELIQKIIDRGVDINGSDSFYTPLMRAAKFGALNMVRILIDAGADLNRRDSEGKIALHLAMAEARGDYYSCKYDDDKRFSIILELDSRGAMPLLDNEGRTPLMSSISRNYYYLN